MLNVIIGGHSIGIGRRFSVSFQRTLRIPDDGKKYPLPPGLGVYPILKVADFPETVPSNWTKQSAFISMYQREALWLGFKAAEWKPNAVKIAVGRVNAISGEIEDQTLHSDPQDYIVCPNQPWLDGINSGHGTIHQFVAMPLGLGYTIESAVTDAERFGGIQVTVFEPKQGVFPDQAPQKIDNGPVRAMGVKLSADMGLAAGGVMKQKIYPDPNGIDVWDLNNHGSVIVHIVSSEQYHEITGQNPLPTPIDAKTYTQRGLPWFDLYDEIKADIAPPDRLTGVKTISQKDKDKGLKTPSDDFFEILDSQVKKLHDDEIR